MVLKQVVPRSQRVAPLLRGRYAGSRAARCSRGPGAHFDKHQCPAAIPHHQIHLAAASAWRFELAMDELQALSAQVGQCSGFTGVTQGFGACKQG
jgi:hypothetical protein